MGGRASSSGFNAYQRNVRKAEDTIRNETVEHLLMLDEQGRIKFRASDGIADQVGLTPEMEANARDAVLTHNHPGGTTLSSDDIECAIYYGMKEVRATTASGLTYVLTRNYDLHQGGKNPPPGNFQNFPKVFSRVTRQAMDDAALKVQRGEISKSQWGKAQSDTRREWLKKNASFYGWTYKEEK